MVTNVYALFSLDRAGTVRLGNECVRGVWLTSKRLGGVDFGVSD